MSLPTHCVDCGRRLPSTFRMISRNPPVGICPPCNIRRQDKRRRRVNTWMHLHREEIGLTNVPIKIIKYCSQAFDDINTGQLGYYVAQRWGGDAVTEPIRVFTRLDTHNQPMFDDIVPDMLKAYSGVDFLIAEIHIEDPSVNKNGEIMNLAVHWNTDDKVLRTILSDALTHYVTSTTGYLRPDYSNVEGWDTFESE